MEDGIGTIQSCESHIILREIMERVIYKKMEVFISKNELRIDDQ